MERKFDEELRLLKERLSAMAGLSEQSIGKVIKALVERLSGLIHTCLHAAHVLPHHALHTLNVLIELSDELIVLRHQLHLLHFLQFF